MASPRAVDCGVGASETLEGAFIPALDKLGTLWVQIADVKRTIERTVDANAPSLAEHLTKTLKSDLKRLDELIFKNVEIMDDLDTVARQYREKRDTTANDQPRVLSVNALDAYLDGAVAFPPPTANHSVQTDATLCPPGIFVQGAQVSSLEIFDVLRREIEVSKVKPKLNIMTEVAPTSSHKHSKKRSLATVNVLVEGERKKREYHKLPRKKIQGRRPIAIHDARKRKSQREYEVEYEGLDDHVWISSRKASTAAKVLIDDYNTKQKAKRRRLTRALVTRRTDADDTDDEMEHDDANNKANDGDHVDGLYIVEKIVDHRLRSGKKQYCVKWDGYDTDENTWEPAAKLRCEVRHIVEEYERDLARQSAKTKKALGRPSNPSVLKKTAPLAGAANLLRESGKIPKFQFGRGIKINAGDSDSGLEDNRLSSDDDLDDFDLIMGGSKHHTPSKVVHFQKLSPQVEL